MGRGRICKNPNCDTHNPRAGVYGDTFTLSTAMNEQDYCSMTCENEVNGVYTKKTKKEKRGKEDN